MTDLGNAKYYEPFATARRDIARTMRKVRRDNPKMARLLYQRMRDAKKEFQTQFLKKVWGT